MNSSISQSENEKTNFFSELKKIADIIQLKYSDTEDRKEMMTHIISFFSKSYPDCKCNSVDITIFRNSIEEFVKSYFVDDSKKLNKLTFELFVIRNCLENNEHQKDKILVLSNSLFSVVDENLCFTTENINITNNKINFKMSNIDEVKEKAKITTNENRLIILIKNNKVESLEKYNESIVKKESNVDAINNISLLEEKTASDAEVNKNEDMTKIMKMEELLETKMMKKMEELESKMKIEKQELESKMKREKEELESKMKKEKEELESKMMKKMEEQESKMKREKEEQEIKFNEKFDLLNVKVDRLERINFSVWLREIMNKVYEIIKKVNNVIVDKNKSEDRIFVITSIKDKNKDFFEFFSPKDEKSNEYFPFAETIIKLLKLRQNCNSLLHFENNKYPFKNSEDYKSTKRVIDTLKEFNLTGELHDEELKNFEYFLDYINYNNVELSDLDEPTNIEIIYYNLINNYQ